jgi:hypothetical protein
MDRDRFTTTLTMLKNRRPFGPFTLAMVNGERLEVDFPDAVALRQSMAVFRAPGGVTVWLDHEGVSEIMGGPAGQSSV